MTVPDRDIEALVNAFVASSDPEKIAKALDVPAPLVLEMLDDPEIGRRAMGRKISTLGVVFAGRIIDNLVEIAAGNNAQAALSAAKLLLERYIEPKKVGRPGTPKESEPQYGKALDRLHE